MKVKNVISLAAANLGREELVAKVEDCAAQPQGELAALLRCYNLVENEVALDYFPLKKEETLSAEEGVIPYGKFSLAPVEVLSVKNAAGEPIGFEQLPSQLVLREKTAHADVLYTYSPAEKEWGDDSEYGGRVSARLLSYGVCCEFCLSGGQYGEAATWEKKYREALRSANVLHKRLSVRARRWA